MGEKQFQMLIKKKVTMLLAIPAEWISAAKIIRTLWPEIEIFRRSGATYRRALEIINQQFDERYEITSMVVICSNVKRDIQS